MLIVVTFRKKRAYSCTACKAWRNPPNGPPYMCFESQRAGAHYSKIRELRNAWKSQYTDSSLKLRNTKQINKISKNKKLDAQKETRGEKIK